MKQTLANQCVHEQKEQQHRKRPERRPVEQRRQRGSRLVTVVEYVADDQYLLRSEAADERPPQPGSPEWFTKLESLPSFHFSGKNGRFTARKEEVQHKGYYWYAYRKYHNKQSKHYIGTTAKLSPDHLEQVAAALQTK